MTVNYIKAGKKHKIRDEKEIAGGMVQAKSRQALKYPEESRRNEKRETSRTK